VWRWEHAEVIEEMEQRMKLEPWKLEARKGLVEHPFGTIKRAFNQGYLLLRGLRKTAGEVGFTMLAYNMRRVFEHSWTEGHSGLACLTARRKEKRATKRKRVLLRQFTA